MSNEAQTIANRPTKLVPSNIEGIYEIINYYMQNKPNFQKSQMNVSIFSQKDYENISDWTLGENKPNQTQFQTQLCQNKPNRTQFLYQLCKANPIKPNLVRLRRIQKGQRLQGYEIEVADGMDNRKVNL